MTEKDTSRRSCCLTRCDRHQDGAEAINSPWRGPRFWVPRGRGHKRPAGRLFPAGQGLRGLRVVRKEVALVRKRVRGLLATLSLINLGKQLPAASRVFRADKWTRQPTSIGAKDSLPRRVGSRAASVAAARGPRGLLLSQQDGRKKKRRHSHAGAAGRVCSSIRASLRCGVTDAAGRPAWARG